MSYLCRSAILRRTLLSLAIASVLPGLAHADEAFDLGRDDVVATTPLPGIDLPRDQVPANIRTLDDEQLRKLGGQSLAEKLQRGLPSVNVNEIQGNPYQADLNYRGFTASPLLGTPQGLSVFLDGVRVNEAFGDVVHWDLIPSTAIADMPESEQPGLRWYTVRALRRDEGELDVDIVTRIAADHGVWLRPFRDLVYTMPPFICTPEDIGVIVRGVSAAVHATVGDREPAVVRS